MTPDDEMRVASMSRDEREQWLDAPGLHEAERQHRDVLVREANRYDDKAEHHRLRGSVQGRRAEQLADEAWAALEREHGTERAREMFVAIQNEQTRPA